MLKSIITIKYLVISILICQLLLSYTAAYTQEQGDIEITNYTPQEYNAKMQNWAAVQDANGIMYFGNDNGILMYDGTEWDFIEIDNSSSIRSLDIDKHGRIFAGGVGAFGYLKRNSLGLMQYIPLEHLLKKHEGHFGDVWATKCINEDVWFGTHDGIHRYRKGEIKTWKQATSISSLITHNQRILAFDRNQGILEMINDSLVNIRHGERFKDKGVLFALSITKNKVLISVFREGLYIYDFDKFESVDPVEKLVTEADSLLTNFIPYTAHQLKNGDIAIGVISKGVIILDRYGKVKRLFNKESGIPHEGITNIFQDREGILWISTMNGISKININSPVSFWGDRFDIQPIINDIERFNNTLYIADNHGVVYLEDNNLNHIPRINTPCLDLQEIIDPEDPSKTIFLGGTNFYGIVQIENNEYKQILKDPVPVIKIFQSSNNRSILYIGTLTGLHVAEYINGNWFHHGSINQIEFQVNNIYEDEKGHLWLNNSSDEIVEIIPSENLLIPSSINKYLIDHPVQEIVAVTKYQGDMIFGCKNGLFKLDNKDSIFKRDDSIVKEINEFNIELLSLKINQKGELVYSGFRNDKFGVGLHKNKKSFQWDVSQYHFLPEMSITSILVEQNGQTWIGGSQGLYNAKPTMVDFQDRFITNISQVKLDVDSVIPTTNSQIISLPYKLNSISFKFYAATFYDETQTLFQSYLEGFDNGWSEWSTEYKRDYTNLREGSYIMHVRSKSIIGAESKANTLHIEISPPWYRSIAAYFIYTVFTILIVWLIIVLNLRRLNAINAELERTVSERTRSLRQANIKLKENQTELEKLSIVARETDNAIIIADEKGNIEWINEGCFKMYGYTVDEIKSRFKSLPNLARFSSELKHTYQECIKTNDTVMSNSIIRHKSGKEISVHRTMTPILDPNSNITKFVIIDSDITKLNELENYKESLIQMIIHDLKNPLNTIIGFSTLKHNPKSHDYIHSAGRQILDMVENILAVHKSETMEIQLSKERVNINYLIDQCVSEVIYIADVKEISIGNEIPHFHLEIDKELIRRVLVNLLSNAIKFSPRNGNIRLTTGIQTIKNKKFFEISIEDEGDGINPKMLNKIFDKYAQADTKKSGEARSTGLGLTFCKLAVEAHLGNITVMSELNKGSIFQVALPI